MNPASPWTLTARWLFPVSQPPLERGTLTIAGDRILAVEPAGTTRPDVDLGEAVLVPGFVNAHTHLDLSGLRGQVPFSGSFTDWLRSVIAHRRGRMNEEVLADVRAGLAESLARGVTLLGDISGQGLSWPLLAAAPLRAVVFYELLGLPQSRAESAWQQARSWLRDHAATSTCRAALSPHAPYSVRASLFQAAAQLAHEQGWPLMTHLAETRAELELLKNHNGPFAAFLQSIGVWEPAGLTQSVEQVIQQTGAAPHVLFAHGNYLDPRTPLPANASIVYCPRTHAFFGQEPHPFRAFLDNGVRVALGTDSLASNPDLDLFAEARYLRQCHPDVSGAALLRMATLSGAEALGWDDETGSLDAGKSADVVALSVPSQPLDDPHALLFAPATAVRRVLFRGQWRGKCLKSFS